MIDCSNFKACRKASQLYSESQERKLTFLEFISMKAHLFVCRTCQIAWSQMTLLKDIYQKYPEGIADQSSSPSKCLSPESKQKIAQEIKKNT